MRKSQMSRWIKWKDLKWINESNEKTFNEIMSKLETLPWIKQIIECQMK